MLDDQGAMAKPKAMRDLRVLAGVTQREAGELVGRSASWIGDVERGFLWISPALAAKLTAFYRQQIAAREALERGLDPERAT